MESYQRDRSLLYGPSCYYTGRPIFPFQYDEASFAPATAAHHSPTMRHLVPAGFPVSMVSTPQSECWSIPTSLGPYGCTAESESVTAMNMPVLPVEASVSAQVAEDDLIWCPSYVAPMDYTSAIDHPPAFNFSNVSEGRDSYDHNSTRRKSSFYGSSSSSLSTQGSSQGSSGWDTCSNVGTFPTPPSSLCSSHIPRMIGLHREYREMISGYASSVSRLEGPPVAIDAIANIWRVDKLLGKWTWARTTWYWVRWSGFSDEYNTWEKQKDISTDLIEEFDANYTGNDFAVERLLKKRTWRCKTQYLVKWKGWGGDNTWESEADISRLRVMEFEASG